MSGNEMSRRGFNVMEALVIAALLGLGGLIFKLNDSVTRLQVAAEATNRQLSALQTQFADVPAMKGQVAELKVRTDRLEQDVKELRSLR